MRVVIGLKAPKEDFTPLKMVNGAKELYMEATGQTGNG